MQNNYIVGIDQSTQGTKALLFDAEGSLLAREDLPHKQMVNALGWVEHDPEEIYGNTVQAVKNLIKKNRINQEEIKAVGISNQRETALVWDRATGKPVYNAIVWQCARGEAICSRLEKLGVSEEIRKATGLRLSPYFSAAKIAWVLENVEGAKEKAEAGRLCFGTMDSYLIYRLTGGKEFKTDYSNASRTQLFHIAKLTWDEDICNWFGINPHCLPKVCDSDSCFGETDFDGYLEKPVPIRGVLGDSHGALFGQGCHTMGMIKATYGTGSSIMMNIGETPVISDRGIVTSLAWKAGGRVQYVLEGNINYTGAVITWLQKDLNMIQEPGETAGLAKEAHPGDQTYLVPAFSGMGAPYWDSNARALLYGMSRVTGRKEIVRAGLDCIAYQITDIIGLMEEEAGIAIQELRVDGGPTRNDYLMQFQSDLLHIPVEVPEAEELSGIGAAWLAGISCGLYRREEVFAARKSVRYEASMAEEVSEKKYAGWKKAVGISLAGSGENERKGR